MSIRIRTMDVKTRFWESVEANGLLEVECQGFRYAIKEAGGGRIKIHIPDRGYMLISPCYANEITIGVSDD